MGDEWYDDAHNFDIAGRAEVMKDGQWTMIDKRSDIIANAKRNGQYMDLYETEEERVNKEKNKKKKKDTPKMVGSVEVPQEAFLAVLSGDK